MITPPTLAQAAALVAAEPAPIVLLDTSAVLDVIRVPLRGNGRRLLDSRDIAAAQELLDGGTNTPRRAWLVSAPLVAKEFAERELTVERELAVYLGEIDERATHARAAWAHLLSRPRQAAIDAGTSAGREGQVVARRL